MARDWCIERRITNIPSRANPGKEGKMDIEAFLLCDCAMESGGKLNVLGAF